MHFGSIAVLFAAVLFVAFSASAASVEASSDVFFFEEPNALVVEVLNDSDARKSLSIEFYAPLDFEFVDNTDSLPAHGRQRVAIVMHPRKDLLGSSYLSTLIVKVGEQTFVRAIELHFKEKKAEEPSDGKEGNKGEESDETALAGLFSLISLDWISAELVLDVFLVIVAAVLLLAFISRYSKRVSQK